MAALVDDLRFAIRQLLKSPGFAAVAVLTCALGIGANTSIFSLIRGVVLKPLGYPDAAQLVFITSQFPGLNFDQFWVSPPEYFELKERNRSFSGIGAYRTGAVNLGTATDPMRVDSAIVTPDLFRVLGVPAHRGRTFTDQEGLPNAAPTVVLSYDTWQRAYAADERIIGKAIQVDGFMRTVVGVMPPRFDVHDAHLGVYVPAGLDPANRTRRGNHFLHLVGRLKPGVSLAQARAELDTLLDGWPVGEGVHTPSPKAHRLRYDPLLDQLIRDVRPALWVLQAAVLAVLLIACANLANLLLARSETRQREFAVRASLGAGRARLLQHFVAEGLVVSILGGAVGVGLAWTSLRAVRAAGLEGIPRLADVALDVPVLLFTSVVALATGVVFGLAPALHFADGSLATTLKESGHRTTTGTARGTVRRALVVAETAAAVVLVVTALLLLRTFWNLTQVDAGFSRDRLVTFGLVLPNATYPTSQGRASFYQRLIDRLSSMPGVERAAAMSGLPPTRDVDANDTEFEGYKPGPGQPPANVDYYQSVTTGYLATMGIRVVEGRGFQPSDATSKNGVALVNEALARRFWPGQTAINRRLRPDGGPATPWLTVVGVVADVKQGGVSAPAGTELYFCYEQLPQLVDFAPGEMNLVLRTRLPLSALAGAIRREVESLDARLPIVDLRTMDDVFVESLSRPRLLARLVAAFAGLALLLAAVGTYGVLSYTVAERRREIGVRMAVGADRGRVLRLVLRDGLVLAGLGVGLGVAGALATSRFASSLLFGVGPADPVSFTAVVVTMTVVAFAACLLPARRAASVDPMVVLRDE